MSRKNERGLELTWHAPSRRWRKRVNGKDYWFGHGKGSSDRASYKAAVARYRQWRDEQTAEALIARLPPGAFVVFPGHVLKAHALQQLHGVAPMNAPAPAEVVKAAESWVEQRGASATPSPQTPTKGASTDQLLDAYEAELRRRYELTAKAAMTLKPKERMGGSAFRVQMASLRGLREHFRAERVTYLSDAPAVERALVKFRTNLDAKVSAGEKKAGGIDFNVKAFRPFFDWAWRNREIAELPRNLARVCAKAGTAVGGKPLDLEVIHQLWAAADDRMRCFIALALNCGYYAIDIATLQPAHLNAQPGYICRMRNKTDIPGKHKLWPLTLGLIARHRTELAGLVFTRQFKGRDLPWIVERPNGKYDALACEFAKLVKGVGVKACWSQLRDTSARHIESISTSGEGTADPLIVEQFLVHHDPRMARAYLGQQPAKLDRTKLDNAISRLAEVYGLADDAGLVASSTREA